MNPCINRCEYCIDSCKNPDPTRCASCDKKEQCHRVLRPTIRITKKCTQECAHCCFSCSPENNEMMSIEKAKEVAMFLTANEIKHMQIMGGEFFMNPDWQSIISILSNNATSVRLVSNSDWIANEKQLFSVIEFLKVHPNIHMSLSYDNWHTNQYVEKASQLLKENNIIFAIANDEDSNENAIVPIGRGESIGVGFYSTFGCFCQKPDHKYSFLIDEKGDIFKCGVGVWCYSSISEYVKGGFKQRFKEVNSVFYNQFIPSCLSCIRQYSMFLRKRKK